MKICDNLWSWYDAESRLHAWKDNDEFYIISMIYPCFLIDLFDQGMIKLNPATIFVDKNGIRGGFILRYYVNLSRAGFWYVFQVSSRIQQWSPDIINWICCICKFLYKCHMYRWHNVRGIYMNIYFCLVEVRCTILYKKF